MDDRIESASAWRLGVMFCWHPRYELGDEQFHHGSHLDEREDNEGRLLWHWRNLENVRQWLVEERGAIATLPLYLYDHGGLLITGDNPSRSIDPGGWDTTAIGFIYTTRERVARVGGAELAASQLCSRLRSEVELRAQANR